MVRSINRKTWLLRTGRAAAGAEQEQQQQHLVRHVKRYKWASHTGSAGSTGRTRADAGGHNATERNIWINAIFYFHILLLLPYNGPDHTHTHTHTGTRVCINGCPFRFIQVASFSFVDEGSLRGPRGLQSIRRH